MAILLPVRTLLVSSLLHHLLLRGHSLALLVHVLLTLKPLSLGNGLHTIMQFCGGQLRPALLGAL